MTIPVPEPDTPPLLVTGSMALGAAGYILGFSARLTIHGFAVTGGVPPLRQGGRFASLGHPRAGARPSHADHERRYPALRTIAFGLPGWRPHPVVMSAVFTLDWLQYRAPAPDKARPGMDVGSVKAVIKHAVVAVCLPWLGLAAWRAGRLDYRTRHAAPPLIRDADPEAP